MPYFFLALALLIAILDWIAVARSWKSLEYFAKPGVMLALLAWLWQVGGFQGQMLWFAAGLLFSMAGDIFLMLPREQFIAGLVAFLLAHLCYLGGFNPTLPPLNLLSLVLALIVAITAAQIFRRVAGGLDTSGQSALKLPVLVYTIVISLMLLSALLTLLRPEWLPVPALLVSAGAMLFFLSDTFLAWNKFVATLPNGKLRVIITYHMGQILIVLGAALHYLRPV
jgi:alkenylglycerophosphocholine/alkenylglycerophosphoethanolamine hydrolase